jgi:hypothetical protein
MPIAGEVVTFPPKMGPLSERSCNQQAKSLRSFGAGSRTGVVGADEAPNREASRLHDAAALDAALASTGKLIGPLHGIPVLVKDNYEVAGLQTTGGSAALLGWVPQADATVIARIRAAGGIILAKTSMSEWRVGRAAGLGDPVPRHHGQRPRPIQGRQQADDPMAVELQDGRDGLPLYRCQEIAACADATCALASDNPSGARRIPAA